MAGKIKPLPKILAGLLVIGALGFFANKALDKVPSPAAIAEQPAAIAAPAEAAPSTNNVIVHPEVAKGANIHPGIIIPDNKPKDAFDALIHEAGKK